MNKFRLFRSTVQPQQQRRTTTQALQCSVRQPQSITEYTVVVRVSQPEIV